MARLTFCRIVDDSWASHGLINFLQNCWCFLASDWLSSFRARAFTKHFAQIWWANSLKAFPDLIVFWSCSTEFPLFPGLLLFGQFLCISRQTDNWIELKFGVPLHSGPPLAWLTLVMPHGIPALKHIPFLCTMYIFILWDNIYMFFLFSIFSCLMDLVLQHCQNVNVSPHFSALTHRPHCTTQPVSSSSKNLAGHVLPQFKKLRRCSLQ